MLFRNSRWKKELRRVRCGGRAESMHALWGGTSHSESAPGHQPGGSLNAVPLGFMEDSLCGMTSLVIGDCTPPSGGLRLVLKVLTLQSHGGVPWQSPSTIGGLGPAQSLLCITAKDLCIHVTERDWDLGPGTLCPPPRELALGPMSPRATGCEETKRD